MSHITWYYKVTQAIEEGVNVVIWSFVSLKVTISPSANDNAVASKIELEASQNIKNLIRYKHQLHWESLDNTTRD